MSPPPPHRYFLRSGPPPPTGSKRREQRRRNDEVVVKKPRVVRKGGEGGRGGSKNRRLRKIMHWVSGFSSERMTMEEFKTITVKPAIPAVVHIFDVRVPTTCAPRDAYVRGDVAQLLHDVRSRGRRVSSYATATESLRRGSGISAIIDDDDDWSRRARWWSQQCCDHRDQLAMIREIRRDEKIDWLVHVHYQRGGGMIMLDPPYGRKFDAIMAGHGYINVSERARKRRQRRKARRELDLLWSFGSYSDLQGSGDPTPAKSYHSWFKNAVDLLKYGSRLAPCGYHNRKTNYGVRGRRRRSHLREQILAANEKTGDELGICALFDRAAAICNK